MLDFASGEPFIPAGFYYDFRQRRSALPSNIVWIGAYLGKRRAAWGEHRGLHIDVDAEEPPNAFVSTFNVFRIVFQVFGHFTKGGDIFTEGRALAAALARI